MFISYSIISKTILPILGLLWCKEVIWRFSKDLNELKTTTNNIKKGVIVFYWLLTIGIICLLIAFICGLIANVAKVI
jgi:hypothetical protein